MNIIFYSLSHFCRVIHKCLLADIAGISNPESSYWNEKYLNASVHESKQEVPGRNAGNQIA